jgi:ubiquinone/menaquinone biosynthesis C-methylase UbiE
MSRSEIDPRVRKFYQNLTQDDAFIITHLVLPQAPAVLKRLQDDPKSKILDIGTGIGAALVHYATYFPKVQQVVGLDIDRPTVQLAQRKVEEVRDRPEYTEFKLDARIEIRWGDATNLSDLSDSELGTYDLITMNLALHEMGAEYRKVLERVCKALKRGGAVVVCDFYTSKKLVAYRDLVYQQWLSLYLHEVLLGSSMILFEDLQMLLNREGFKHPCVVGHPINGYLMVLAEKEI